MGVSPGPQRRVDAEELRREVLVAQGYDRVNLCGEHKERMGKVGRGGGGIERIEETPAIRKPIMLNRYSKYLYFKSPRGAYLFEAYLRGWLNRDRGLI